MALSRCYFSCLSISVGVRMHTHKCSLKVLFTMSAQIVDQSSLETGVLPASLVPAELLHRFSSFTLRIPTTFNFTGAWGPLDPLWLWPYTAHSPGCSPWAKSLTHILSCVNTANQAQLEPNRAAWGFAWTHICSLNCYLPLCPQLSLFVKLHCPSWGERGLIQGRH